MWQGPSRISSFISPALVSTAALIAHALPTATITVPTAATSAAPTLNPADGATPAAVAPTLHTAADDALVCKPAGHLRLRDSRGVPTRLADCLRALLRRQPRKRHVHLP